MHREGKGTVLSRLSVGGRLAQWRETYTTAHIYYRARLKVVIEEGLQTFPLTERRNVSQRGDSRSVQIAHITVVY